MSLLLCANPLCHNTCPEERKQFSNSNAMCNFCIDEYCCEECKNVDHDRHQETCHGYYNLPMHQLPLPEALEIIQGSEGYCASKVLKEEILMDPDRVRKLDHMAAFAEMQFGEDRRTYDTDCTVFQVLNTSGTVHNLLSTAGDPVHYRKCCAFAKRKLTLMMTSHPRNAEEVEDLLKKLSVAYWVLTLNMCIRNPTKSLRHGQSLLNILVQMDGNDVDIANTLLCKKLALKKLGGDGNIIEAEKVSQNAHRLLSSNTTPLHTSTIDASCALIETLLMNGCYSDAEHCARIIYKAVNEPSTIAVIPTNDYLDYLAGITALLSRAIAALARSVLSLGLVVNAADREARRKTGEETLALARSALAMDIQRRGSKSWVVAHAMFELTGILDAFVENSEDEQIELCEQARIIHEQLLSGGVVVREVGACLLHLSCLYWGKADEKHDREGSTCTSVDNTNNSTGTVNSINTIGSANTNTSMIASNHTWPPGTLPSTSPTISPGTSAKAGSGNGNTNIATTGDVGDGVMDAVNGGGGQDDTDHDGGDVGNEDVQTFSGECKEQEQEQRQVDNETSTEVKASASMSAKELYEKALVLARDAGAVFATVNCDDLAVVSMEQAAAINMIILRKFRSDRTYFPTL